MGCLQGACEHPKARGDLFGGCGKLLRPGGVSIGGREAFQSGAEILLGREIEGREGVDHVVHETKIRDSDHWMRRMAEIPEGVR